MSNDNRDMKEKQSDLDPKETTQLQLRSLNTLLNVAIIGGLLSLIFGALFFSCAALIATIVALIKLKKIALKADPKYYAGSIRLMRTRVIVSFVISIVALIYSVYTFATIIPMLNDMLNGNTIDSTMDSLRDSIEGGSADSSGTMNPNSPGNRSVFG